MSVSGHRVLLVAIGATIYKRERDTMSKGNTSAQTETEVKVYENAVYASHETTASTKLREDGTPDLSGSHFSRTLEVSVHAHSDGLHSFGIQDRTFTYLRGVWNDSHYQNHKEADIMATLAQLEAIAEALNTFIAGVKNGDISAS